MKKILKILFFLVAVGLILVVLKYFVWNKDDKNQTYKIISEQVIEPTFQSLMHNFSGI